MDSEAASALHGPVPVPVDVVVGVAEGRGHLRRSDADVVIPERHRNRGGAANPVADLPAVLTLRSSGDLDLDGLGPWLGVSCRKRFREVFQARQDHVRGDIAGCQARPIARRAKLKLELAKKNGKGQKQWISR